MARVTVEDCIEIIPNRFDLVITAAQRAKQISSGVPLTIDRDKDKDGVVALREIAGKTIDLELVREEMVQSFQRQSRPDFSDGSEGIIDSAEDMEAAFAAVAQRNKLSDEDFMAQDYGGSLSFIEDNVEVDD